MPDPFQMSTSLLPTPIPRTNAEMHASLSAQALRISFSSDQVPEEGHVAATQRVLGRV